MEQDTQGSSNSHSITDQKAQFAGETPLTQEVQEKQQRKRHFHDHNELFPIPPSSTPNSLAAKKLRIMGHLMTLTPPITPLSHLIPSKSIASAFPHKHVSCKSIKSDADENPKQAEAEKETSSGEDESQLAANWPFPKKEEGEEAAEEGEEEAHEEESSDSQDAEVDVITDNSPPKCLHSKKKKRLRKVSESEYGAKIPKTSSTQFPLSLPLVPEVAETGQHHAVAQQQEVKDFSVDSLLQLRTPLVDRVNVQEYHQQLKEYQRKGRTLSTPQVQPSVPAFLQAPSTSLSLFQQHQQLINSLGIFASSTPPSPLMLAAAAAALQAPYPSSSFAPFLPGSNSGSSGGGSSFSSHSSAFSVVTPSSSSSLGGEIGQNSSSSLLSVLFDSPEQRRSIGARKRWNSDVVNSPTQGSSGNDSFSTPDGILGSLPHLQQQRQQGKGVVKEKEYECSECHKVFGRLWLLTNHHRTHTGEKPFECPSCHRCFADKSNLRAHVQTHNEEKRFQCGNCGRRFSLKSYLSKHEESSCGRPMGVNKKGNKRGRPPGNGGSSSNIVSD